MITADHPPTFRTSYVSVILAVEAAKAVIETIEFDPARSTE
jgi:hypothetical protein